MELIKDIFVRVLNTQSEVLTDDQEIMCYKEVNALFFGIVRPIFELPLDMKGIPQLKNYSNDDLSIGLSSYRVTKIINTGNNLFIQTLPINEDDFVIVSVVNMVPVKGIEILLNAVRLLKDSKIKVFLIGNDQSEYVADLKKEYSENQFVFLGKQLDVKPYLALANVFVIPTKDEGRKEGMPIAPLEAMAMGIPVIGSKISGIKDILKEYPELLFEPSNSEDLSNKIVSVRETTIDSVKMVDMVNKKFSLVTFIKQREQLYKTLIKK